MVDQEQLPIAAARALIAGACETGALERAAKCLSKLADRPDLPDARLLRETAVLRLAGRGVDPELMSRERLQQFEEQLPDCSRKAFFLAECYYQFARDAQGPAEGCWRACQGLAQSCLAGLPGAAMNLPEREEAELLRDVARLMLGLEPSAGLHRQAAVPKPKGLPYLVGGRPFRVALCSHPMDAEGIRAGGARGIRSAMAPTVLRSEDENLLRFVVAQACRLQEASELARDFRAWRPESFFAIRLLQARQALLEGGLMRHAMSMMLCYNRRSQTDQTIFWRLSQRSDRSETRFSTAYVLPGWQPQ